MSPDGQVTQQKELRKVFLKIETPNHPKTPSPHIEKHAAN